MSAISPLPRGWVWTTLGEVCLINPRHFAKVVADDHHVSFVPMAAVEAITGRIDASQGRPYREVKRGYTPFSEGDVLFAKITPCMENGKIAVAKGLENGSACGSTEFHVLRPLNGMAGELLMYYLFQDDFRKEARGHMTGTAGQLRVPAKFLDESPFPLPPLPEQRRIVAEVEKHFTRLDAAVAALQRARVNLKRYRASVLRTACEGRLVPTEAELARQEGRDYEPAPVLLERILKERRAQWEAQDKRRGKYREPQPTDTASLPPLPEGWEWATLGQVSDIQGGIQKQPKRAPRNNAFPFLRVANVFRERLELSEVHSIELFAGELEKLRLAPGDLLIVEGNGSVTEIGRMAIWDGSIPNCVHQNHIIRARMLGGLLPQFVSAYWNSPEGTARVMRVAASTSGLYTLSVSKVSVLPVPLPPLAEQQRIVAEVERHLSVIQAAENVVETNLKRAGRLRQAILKRAFEGKLVPQDPSDEPSSVLLERIREGREAAERDGAAGRRRTGRQSKVREVSA